MTGRTTTNVLGLVLSAKGEVLSSLAPDPGTVPAQIRNG